MGEVIFFLGCCVMFWINLKAGCELEEKDRKIERLEKELNGGKREK